MKIVRWCLAAFFALLLVFLGGTAMPVTKAPVSPPKTEEERGFYDYDLSEYLELGDITAPRASFEETGVCTEKEVDAQVFQILLALAEFTPRTGPAERYNKVFIDFSLSVDGVLQEDYSKENYPIVIGLNTEDAMDTVMGEALMGSVAGETRQAKYRFPEDAIGQSLSGKEALLSATVRSVESPLIPELIDAKVEELFGPEITTVADFRESVRTDILEEKELARAQAVWLVVFESANVRRYPERELKEYKDLFVAYYEGLAKDYGLTLENLVTVYLEEDMDTFYARAEESAKEKVKNDMIFTQLVRLQDISLTQEEYEAGLLDYFEKEEQDFASMEEFEAYYTKESLERSILWDKALKAVVGRAVRIDQ